MLNKLRYLNLTLVLPDGRVLLKRNNHVGMHSTSLWSMTEERFLSNEDDCSAKVEYILSDNYKICTKKPQNFPSSTVYSVMYIPQIYDVPGRIVLPVVVKTKEQLNFTASPTYSFRAIRFKDLLREIFKNSIYAMSSIHTSTCIHVAKECQEKGVI